MLAYRLAALGGLLGILACNNNSTSDHDRNAEAVASTESAIQGGVLATNENYSVALRLPEGLCTGTLIAPNLVLTARHCVEIRPAQTSDGCENEELLEPSEILVTPSPKALLATAKEYTAVSKILVGPKKNGCDPDIAMVELEKPFNIGSKVALAAPAVDPATLAEPHFTPLVVAVGYGRDDQANSGTRRKRENIQVMCVPKDSEFDCGADTESYFQPFEIIAGEGACQGDSGGGLYDQKTVKAGKPMVVATVSRGGVDENGMCSAGVYVRVSEFSDWIIKAAKEAADRGGYDYPEWTGEAPKPKPPEQPTDDPKDDDDETSAPTKTTPSAETEEAPVAPKVVTVTKSGCSSTPSSTSSSGSSGFAPVLAIGVVVAVSRRRRRR